MIGRLGFGEMRVKLGDKVTRYYLDGGFVQVSGNIVSVLTNRAALADQIDAQTAQLQLDKARELTISTPEQEEIRDRSLAQARGQLWVSRRA
jgi:F-type H+-transporting ATPase subunit epsilon